jgi:rhamnogalacturonan endolyase
MFFLHFVAEHASLEVLTSDRIAQDQMMEENRERMRMMPAHIRIYSKWAFGAVLSVSVAFAGELFRDDFSRIPPRVLSEPIKQLTNAIQEYHYLEHRGVSTQPWENAIIHMDVWAGGDEDGKPYLEQHEVNPLPRELNPIMITGDPEWFDYTLEAKVRPLQLSEMAGIVFRYRTNRHYCLFALSGGNKVRLAVRLPLGKIYQIAEWKELGAAEFPYDVKRYYALKVENKGAEIRAFVDGKLLIESSYEEIRKGRVGVTSNIPTRFTDVRVSAPDGVESLIRENIAKRDQELARLRESNPKPKLWKKFSTPRFGAGRNVRFGDLDGDGQTDMLIAQNVRKASQNSFDHISCLTAVNLDGKVLWQSGRPDPYNDFLANDTPFQIHDLDGDGKNEVLVVRDFKIQILDGKTGQLRHWTWMPEAPRDNKQRPYELEVGDSIAFADLTGRKARTDIIIKDRYRTFWVFNKELHLLWRGQANLGHYPFPLDIDGDGREEILIGYSLFGADGRQLWTKDKELKDHADGVVMGNFSGVAAAPMRVYFCASDDGHVVLDLQGNILKHTHIGHAQSPSIGKFRPDLPGVQMITTNFWRNPGIVTLFDHEGNILAQEEPIHSASPLLPVNWRGDGQEFAMLSANAREGGMIDGQMRRVVMFPDDGHPDLTFNVMNLTGDERDEIVVWDANHVWIYTQDRPFEGKRIYAPVRNPDYNESNYRTTVSLPAWKENRKSVAGTELPHRGLKSRK